MSTVLSLRPAERDDRSLAFVLALGALSAAALLPFAPVLAPFAPGCPFHALTGLPCPGCGTTRAVVALAHGDFLRALAWNPLATLALLVGGAACLVAPLWVAAGLKVPVLAPTRGGRAAIVVAIALQWAWLIARHV